MPNGDAQQTQQTAQAPSPVPDLLADLRIRPVAPPPESLGQKLKRNVTPEMDTSRSSLGPGHEFDSDTPQMEGEQQYKENFGSPLERAYGHLKSFLQTHEQHVSEKYLAPFRNTLDLMSDDLEQAGSSGHTKTGGQLNFATRALAGGMGAALRMVPVGRDVKETVGMAITPPEFPEGKALSKEIKAARSVEKSAKELPPQPRLPDTGTHAAIKTDDGGIYFDDAPEKQRTHITLARELGIPPERVVSGGWLNDGHYEASARSDAGRWGEQARAQAAVAEKKAAQAAAVARNRPQIAQDNISRAKQMGIETTPAGNLVHGTKSGDLIRNSGKIKQGSYLAADEKTARQYAEGAAGPDAKTEIMRVEVPAGTVLGSGNYFSANEEIPYKAATPKPPARVSGQEVVKHAQKYSASNMSAKDAEELVGLDAAGDYELKDIPTKKLKAGDGYDPALAKKYATTDTPIPAIILDGDGRIRDGNHRVAAAKIRGDKTIKAYVPINDYDPAEAEARQKALRGLGEKSETPKAPDAKARERELNLKHVGIGLTEMNPTDAKNWVGYEGQKTFKVYRGVDDPSHTIQPGDFVTTSKESAQNYGKHIQELEVSPSELRYVRGHQNGDPKLLDIGGQTELIYAPKKTPKTTRDEIAAKATAKLGKK